MTSSVRARLTVAVVVVVGATAVTTALLAPRLVETSLVADRLDAEVPGERSVLIGEFTVVTGAGEQVGNPQLTALFGPDIASLATSLERSGVLDDIRSQRADGDVVVAPIPGVLGVVDDAGRVRVESGAPSDAGGPIITGRRMEQLAARYDPASVFQQSYDVFTGGSATLDDFIRDLDERLDGNLGNLDLGGIDLGDLGLDQIESFDDLAQLGEQLFGDDFFGDLQDELADEVPGLETTLADPDDLVVGTRDIDGVDVIVTGSIDGIDITTDRVRTALWFFVPLAMALSGIGAWVLAGRALRPVRAITDQTSRIRAGTLHERVPVPGGSDEVSGLAVEMNEMLDRLEREDRKRRQFIADASHELRSPIASIHAQAEVVAGEATAGSAEADLADGVLAEADRLGVIVDDLLSLARHDEALQPPGASVDLDDVVLEEARRPRRVPVETSAVSGGRVRAQSDEMARVVRHLLDNAARHATSTVHVSLQTVDDQVQLVVDDDGAGVPEDDRNRIFERFVRLDDARARDAGGAGLGLAVVDTVVGSAGGRITVGDADLGGARFVVELPAAE